MEAFVNSLTQSLAGFFGDNIWLATIVISMIPIMELKVGIPFAQARGYSVFQSLLFGMIGSAIVVAILALCFIPLIRWLKTTRKFKNLAISIEKKVNAKSNKINENAISEIHIIKNFWIKFFGVVLFVAIPIPLTGIWTGACIAVVLGLNFWQTLASTLLGNLIAGIIVAVLSTLISEQLIFLIMLCLVVILIIAIVIKAIVGKIKRKKMQDNSKE